MKEDAHQPLVISGIVLPEALSRLNTKQKKKRKRHNVTTSLRDNTSLSSHHQRERRVEAKNGGVTKNNCISLVEIGPPTRFLHFDLFFATFSCCIAEQKHTLKSWNERIMCYDLEFQPTKPFLSCCRSSWNLFLPAKNNMVECTCRYLVVLHAVNINARNYYSHCFPWSTMSG